jgi:hypothetical protein
VSSEIVSSTSGESSSQCGESYPVESIGISSSDSIEISGLSSHSTRPSTSFANPKLKKLLEKASNSMTNENNFFIFINL